MEALVQAAEAFPVDVGVDLGRGDVGVAEHGLERAQVGAPLEEVAGVKFDIDKLREVISLSKKCTELWKQVLATAAAVLLASAIGFAM